MKRGLGIAQYVFFAAGAALLVYCAATIGRQKVSQAYENWRLNRSLANQPAVQPAPRHIEPGDVLGRLDVPRLGLSVMVWEGDSKSVLSKGAGHLTETALPGQPGNVAIAGHRDTDFRPLKDIRKDDVVKLTTPAGTYTYRVESTEIVPPTFSQVLDPTAYPALTLVTCYPFYYIGAAPKRFIVRARELNTAAATPATAMAAPQAAARAQQQPAKPPAPRAKHRRPRASAPKNRAVASLPSDEPAAGAEAPAAAQRKPGFFRRIFRGIARSF